MSRAGREHSRGSASGGFRVAPGETLGQRQRKKAGGSEQGRVATAPGDPTLTVRNRLTERSSPAVFPRQNVTDEARCWGGELTRHERLEILESRPEGRRETPCPRIAMDDLRMWAANSMSSSAA